MPEGRADPTPRHSLSWASRCTSLGESPRSWAAWRKLRRASSLCFRSRPVRDGVPAGYRGSSLPSLSPLGPSCPPSLPPHRAGGPKGRAGWGTGRAVAPTPPAPVPPAPARLTVKLQVSVAGCPGVAHDVHDGVGLVVRGHHRNLSAPWGTKPAQSSLPHHGHPAKSTPHLAHTHTHIREHARAHPEGLSRPLNFLRGILRIDKEPCWPGYRMSPRSAEEVHSSSGVLG